MDDKQLQLLIDKVEDVTDLSWQDIIDELGLDISRDSLRKQFGGQFGGYAVMRYLQDKNIGNSDDATDLRELKQELYKERIRLQDQRRSFNKGLKEEARFEHLKEVLLERLYDLPELTFNKTKLLKTDGVEGALLFSDVHYGLKIDTPLNYYDVAVSQERIEQMTDKTIEYCLKNGVTKLSVCLLGDFVSGMIHNSVRVEQEEDVITQLMDFSEILAQVVTRLRESINDVVVYSTWGNHSRIIQNKKESINRENLERLVPFYLKNRVPSDVKIIDSHGVDYIEATIGGLKTVITHGDKDTPMTAVNNFVRILGYVPEQVFLSHIHEYNEKDDCDCQITVNGSVCSTDEYALSLRKATKPCQILKIYGVYLQD